MKELLVITALFIISFKTTAQKINSHFVDHISVSINFGSDRFMVDKNELRNQWRDPNRQTNYNLDSLNYEKTFAKCGLVLPRLNVGLRVQVIKDLFTNNNNRLLNRKIQITTGLGLYHIKYRQDPLRQTNGYGYPDTNKIYRNEYLSFTQDKAMLQLNQAIIYKFNSFLIRDLKYFLGLGYLLSTETRNIISESHSIDSTKYNSASQRFQTFRVVDTKADIPGKHFTNVALFVPFGFTFKLAHRNDFLFEVDYSVSRNRFTDVYKKNEAWQVHFGYSYNFSR